jgi:hypothetical protein
VATSRLPSQRAPGREDSRLDASLDSSGLDVAKALDPNFLSPFGEVWFRTSNPFRSSMTGRQE